MYMCIINRESQRIINDNTFLTRLLMIPQITNGKFVSGEAERENKFPLKWPSPLLSPIHEQINFYTGRAFYTIELRIDVVVKESFESVREHVMGKITVCLFFFFFFHGI